MTNSDHLRSEIKAVRKGLQSAMVTRKDHPSYGVTKKNLWARYYRLEGMLYAYLYTTGSYHADVALGAMEAGTMLGIDLRALSREIEEA